jgi:hypothetical protein
LSRRSNRKRIKRVTIRIVVFALLPIVAQVVWFHYIYFRSSATHPAEAIVVFDGDPIRVEAGFALLDRDLSRGIMVSPATAERMEGYRARYTRQMAAALYAEPHARTTYENAYYCANLIRASDIRSVILVTSSDHMPRAFTLLLLCLQNKDIDIQRYSVASARAINSDEWAWIVEEKALYNEMIKFWGSLYELAYHRLTAKMAPRSFRQSEWIQGWEERLLFEP